MKTWGPKEWEFFLGIVAVLGYFLHGLFEVYREVQVLIRYAAWAVLLVSIIKWNTKR